MQAGKLARVAGYLNTSADAAVTRTEAAGEPAGVRR